MSVPNPLPALDAVNVHCPHCGAAFPVRREVLGRLAKCTTCAQRFVLREAELSLSQEPPDDSAASPLAQPAEATPAKVPSASESLSPQPAPQVGSAAIPPPPPAESVATHRTDPSEAPPLPRAAPLLSPSQTIPRSPTPDIDNPPRAIAILRFAASGMEVLAALCFATALFVSVALMIRSLLTMTAPMPLAPLLAIGFSMALWSGVSVCLFLVAQGIRLALRIEENSRQTLHACRTTAAACESLASQAEAAAGLEEGRESS